MQKAIIITKLRSYSCYFRLGRSLEVMESLVDFLIKILPTIEGNNRSDSDAIKMIFSSILACQEREDWLGLADYLEYDLPQILIKISED